MSLQKILSGTVFVAGLVIAVGAVWFWFVVEQPLQGFVTQTDHTLKDLRSSIGQLKQDMSAMPKTLKTTRESLEAAASSTTDTRTLVSTSFLELMKVLSSIKDDAKVVSEFGDRAKGFSNTTANYFIPLPEAAREFHKLRNNLYQVDTALKTTSAQTIEAADQLIRQLTIMQPGVLTTLSSVTESLRAQSSQIEAVEKGVLPTFPLILGDLASELQEFVSLLKVVLPAMAVLSAVIFSIGIAFAGHSLKGLL